MSDDRHRRLLRAAHERPRHRRAGYGSDEIPSAHAALHPWPDDVFVSKPSRMKRRRKGYAWPPLGRYEPSADIDLFEDCVSGVTVFPIITSTGPGNPACASRSASSPVGAVTTA